LEVGMPIAEVFECGMRKFERGSKILPHGTMTAILMGENLFRDRLPNILLSAAKNSEIKSFRNGHYDFRIHLILPGTS